MSNSNDFKGFELTIPAFGKSPAISLDMKATRESESRFIEVKTVNPSTYVDLEHTFNESYRELKRHHASVGYQIAMAEKAIKAAKADVLLGHYAEFMKDKPKNHDNADMREAFLTRDEAYNTATDRLVQLKAIEDFIDGRLKVVENVCRFMRQQMQLIIKSGLSNSDYYVTIKDRQK